MTAAANVATTTATVAARVSRMVGQVTFFSSLATSSETVCVRGTRQATTAAAAAMTKPTMVVSDQSSPNTAGSLQRAYVKTSARIFSRNTPSASAARTKKMTTILFGSMPVALPSAAMMPRLGASGLLPGSWQARVDSNPQPADLETAALAVRATGLCVASGGDSP